MATPAINIEPRLGHKPFIMVGLLTLVIFINYVDRGNLATAAPLIKDEMHLSNTAFGLLVSAFFWTYVPGQLIVGWMAHRFNTYIVIAGGVTLWALATVLIGFTSGFAVLLGLRLLLGIGESVAFPCSSKLIAEHVPQNQVGKANGLTSVGLALGPAFGVLVGGHLMARYGWRITFIAFGLFTLLWLVPWITMYRNHKAMTTYSGKVRNIDESPSFFQVFQCRDAWGCAVGHFGSVYTFYFVITWLPLYLVKVRGFTLAEMANIGAVIYIIYAISAVAFGWLADRWIANGTTRNRVTKTMVITGTLGAAIAMMVCSVGSQTVIMVSLGFSGICSGLVSPNTYAIGQTLAGPTAAGKWIGFQNCIGNTAGIVGPIITGYLIDRTGNYSWAFALAGLVSLVSITGWGIVIRKVEPVDWATA